MKMANKKALSDSAYLGDMVNQLYELEQWELRRLAWEALLISDGPDSPFKVSTTNVLWGSTSELVAIVVMKDGFKVYCSSEAGTDSRQKSVNTEVREVFEATTANVINDECGE
jgi:hypothetical protein